MLTVDSYQRDIHADLPDTFYLRRVPVRLVRTGHGFSLPPNGHSSFLRATLRSVLFSMVLESQLKTASIDRPQAISPTATAPATSPLAASPCLRQH